MTAVIAAWFRILARVSLVGALMVLQALTPLLHAHFGSSQLRGVHIHTLASRAVDSHFLGGSHVDEAGLTSSESAEVDVERGAPARQLRLADTSAAWLLVAVLAIMALKPPVVRALLIRLRARAIPSAPRWRPPNSPPPAFAPPLFS